MGDVVINNHAQALRKDGSVIDGLYAAGAAIGGFAVGPQIDHAGRIGAELCSNYLIASGSRKLDAASLEVNRIAALLQYST